MRIGMVLLLPVIGIALSGCVVGAVASTAVAVATAPVKAVGYTADKLTTSQEEADRNYGRKMRKKEAREGREARKRQKEWERQQRRR
ncbi:MAG: hypothetical protein PGN09_11860 [Sphingomonas fennica]